MTEKAGFERILMPTANDFGSLAVVTHGRCRSTIPDEMFSIEVLLTRHGRQNTRSYSHANLGIAEGPLRDHSDAVSEVEASRTSAKG